MKSKNYTKKDFGNLKEEIFNKVIQDYGPDMEKIWLRDDMDEDDIHGMLSRISHDLTHAIINQEY